MAAKKKQGGSDKVVPTKKSDFLAGAFTEADAQKDKIKANRAYLKKAANSTDNRARANQSDPVAGRARTAAQTAQINARILKKGKAADARNGRAARAKITDPRSETGQTNFWVNTTSGRALQSNRDPVAGRGVLRNGQRALLGSQANATLQSALSSVRKKSAQQAWGDVNNTHPFEDKVLKRNVNKQKA